MKEEERKSSEFICPSCGCSITVRDYKQNKVICRNCGLVLKEDIKDRGPEWRAFDQKQREGRSRVGSPMTYTIHDKGLSTLIDWRNRDSHGKSLPPERRSVMYRLRKWQRRVMLSGSKNRNLAFALSEIDRMASRLGLPRTVRENASKIYREAVEKDLVRGRSMEGVASAALYAACREGELPRTLKEIVEASHLDKREIRRDYLHIARELDIDLPPTDPAKYVARFGSKLSISGKARVEAVEIIRKAREEKLTSGKSPTGTAAAAIYIASLKTGERRTQREVASVADITEVTVRNRYKELVEDLGREIEV